MKARPQDRFTDVARDYARWRPDYPRELFAWVAAQARLAPGARVVDVGCGTGISTRLWASLGFAVVGVEPNEAMLARAREEGGAEYRRGDAEATGLPDRGAELVAAAQAFHWFELDRALAEFARLLKPGGKAAAIWNQRERIPLLQEYAALLSRFATEYDERPKSAETLARLKAHPRARGAVERSLEHAQSLDREGFFGRVHSASYVALSVRDRKGFDDALSALFDKYQKGGRVELVYRAVALVFEVA